MRLAQLLADEVWRHQEMAFDPGGGGGGGDDSFPYGPADRAGGLYDPGQLAPWWHPQEPSYPTGPSNYRSYQHRPPTPAPPPDPWAGISASAHSAAISLTDKLGGTLGWPAGFDVNGNALAMAKAGINLSSAFDAYEWLFQNKLSDDQRNNNPWAEFGMIKDDYIMTTGKLNSVFFDWTGNNTLEKDTMKSAIKEGWTPDQIRNFAMYGNAEGTGEMLDVAKFTGDMPWLSAGQTYSQTLQQFQSFEDHAPADKQTLAAFWRFGQSAKQIGGGREAIVTAPQQRQQESIVR